MCLWSGSPRAAQSPLRPLESELTAAAAITQEKSMETSFGCIFNLVGCELRGRHWSVPLVRIDGQGRGQSIWLTRSFGGVGVGNVP